MVKAHPKRSPIPVLPTIEQEAERGATFRQADVFERAELIQAGDDKGQPTDNRAIRSQAKKSVGQGLDGDVPSIGHPASQGPQYGIPGDKEPSRSKGGSLFSFLARYRGEQHGRWRDRREHHGHHHDTPEGNVQDCIRDREWQAHSHTHGHHA